MLYRHDARGSQPSRSFSQPPSHPEIVPRVSKAPGFVSGYWTRKDNTGLSMVIFESEEAANAMSEQVRSMVPDAITVEEVEVREVAAHA